MSETPAVNPCLCPLCGQPNGCAMAAALLGTDAGAGAGDTVSACWCTQVVFSPALLQQVPPQAVDKACICQTCVQAQPPSQADA